MSFNNEVLTICRRKDCKMNNNGYCFPIKEYAPLKNGTMHRLNLMKCPFFKPKDDADKK